MNNRAHVHKYQKKDRHGNSGITKYRNVNFISCHQTCYLIGNVLSKCRTSPKVMTNQKMNGLVVSLSAETFLNTGHFCLLTKPSSWLRALCPVHYVLVFNLETVIIINKQCIMFGNSISC